MLSLTELKHAFALPISNPVLGFSIILLIILLAPLVLKKLNIPGIIGLILSGIIIGPFGLNLIEKNAAVEWFSTIGLLYIMFIAGLELDLAEFRIYRLRSIIFGIFTFTIPVTVGYLVCIYVLRLDPNAALLTASMLATHTLVAYPIISKMGVSKNKAVGVAVGGTILTDTAALVSLALIVNKSQGTFSPNFLIGLGVSLAIFSAIMFLVIPRIAKWFFQHLESEKHGHYIFVLFIVFFSAFLAHLAGVEHIIGAFVAGLVLNRLIPHSSALMNRIEFIGSSLFIPFFLISVGMLVNIGSIIKDPTALYIAGGLAIASFIGKWSAAWFMQLFFGYSKYQRGLIYGLSGAHAAATLAIALVGFRAKIVDENVINGTIILILVSCILASFAAERAAKKILLSEENLPTPDAASSKSEHILVPVSKEENIQSMVEFAVILKERKSANPISVLTVVGNDHDSELNVAKARKKLEECAKQASASETTLNLITTIDHTPASGIGRIAREISSNFVIIGWPHRPGFFEKLFGEKADTIVSTVNKKLCITYLNKPLIANKRLLLITPPNSERELGFFDWITKIIKLSNELSLPIVHLGHPRTHLFVGTQLKRNNINSNIANIDFTDWDSFLIIAHHVRNDDLIVVVSSRKGCISYFNQLENIPAILEKHFNSNSKLILFPERNVEHTYTDFYEDINSDPLTKSIETLGKTFRGIIRSSKSDKS